MKSFFLLIFFAFLTASTAQNNPLKDPNVCGRPTCKGTGKFKYAPGTQQNYKYTVDVRSLFNGTSRNESSFFIQSTVTLDFLTPCDGILSLSDIKLSDNPISMDENFQQHINSEIFGEMLSEYTLRFAFNDGIISEICPQDDEKNWVLNFKRGLLSMLHNTMKRFDLDHYAVEEDVRGKCTTYYNVKGAKETSLIIEKTKDLDNCQNRAKLHSIVQSVPYNFGTKLQGGKNLLKSSSKCELSIDHHIYNEITCEEIHFLQLFSNQDSGAATIFKQKLILLNEYKLNIDEQPMITRRTSLLYDHIPSPKPTHGELRTSRDLIKKMCKQSTDDVQIEFSDLFTKFIQTLRILSYPSLAALYGHSSTTCPTGKKHLLDALPYVGSSASIILMKDIILQQGVSESIAKEWMMSLAFIVRPDEEMMKASAQLFQEKSFDTNVMLSITALTHTYCSQNTDCIYNEAVSAILQTVENYISEIFMKKDLTRDERDKVMVALKSLGNLGIVSEYFKVQLKHIIEDVDVDVVIRVAVVEAHRRLNCEEFRDYFQNLFRNQYEDVEVRIASYLQVMRCPNYLTIQIIKHSLEDEQVNQVGSFVWSHLSNLMKSSIPSRVEIQGLLSDMNLQKKFSSDIRKFSHNREGSIYFDEYDIGASYDNNIIFSPKSYVPRSAMLNLTVDLFGESINLLEVYGRMEGFEHYLESMFGPKGPLNSKKLVEKIPKMRWGRSTSGDEILKSQIDKLPNVMENSFSEPKVSLGMKVFGNELKYTTFDGDEEIRAALQTFNPVDHLKRILSGKEINYNKAAMFLDSNYVIPSSAGLPITLSAIGTASINLKLFGSLHTNNFAKTKELDLKADVRPSVSLDLTGVMSVDAFYASTGIKLSSSMYTSSAIEGIIKIRGTSLVSVKFSIPRQTSEILGAKSELIVMKHDVEQVQSGLSGRRASKSICSWPAVDKTVGLKLCGEYHFINVTKINTAPYFVLAGPAGFRVFLEKSDPTAKIYLFEYKWIDRDDKSIVSLTFDTPGSTIKHLMAANFTVDKQSQNLTLFLQSSAGTVLARGKYKNTDQEKYLQLALNINDKKHFDFSASLIRQDSRHGYLYYPRIYLGVSGDRVLELQGTLKLMSKKGISDYHVDLKFQTKRLTSKLFGYISKAEASIAANMKLDYKFASTKEQRVMWKFLLANRSPKNMVDIRGSCSLYSTSYPEFNFDANLKFQRGNGPIEYKFDLSTNPLPADHPDAELHKLKFEWLFSYKSLPDSTRTLNTIVSINKQLTNLNLKGQFSYESKGSNINILTIIKYGIDKEISITIFWSHPRTTLEQIEGRINITLPSFTPMVLEGKLREKAASDYIIEVQGTWFSGHSATALGFYQDRSTPRSLDHHLKLFLKSPSFKDINADLKFYRNDEEIKLDIKANTEGNDYGLLFKHSTVSPDETSTQVKLKYKTKYYTMSSSIYLGDHRRIIVEFHIDQLRDIYIAAWEYNRETNKALGFEVKWDANRDNNQKLMVSGNFTKLGSFEYEGNFLVSYPGRTILGDFNFLLAKQHFDTMARISWADQQSFAYSFQVDYDVDRQTFFLIKSQIVTPFEGWQRTSFNGSYHHNGNMYRINGSIFWKHDEYVTVDLFEDYSIGESFDCKLKSSLTSTLSHIPSLSALLIHNQNTTKIDTILKLMYDPQHMIDIKSNWKIEENGQYTNITGTIIATTPFNGYHRGYLIGKLDYTNTKYIRGFADLDLDHKKFTASLEGNLQKLTNSMIVLNVTTPMEKFKQLEGRFGFSEERKHLVAQITHPNGGLGFEILFNVQTIINFDVKLSLATPISFLQQILIVGKLKPDRADFRVGWNSLMLGFTGVWYYVNVIDFEYSYKIYTPIEGFEENGIVTKLIFKEGLDFEVSVKLSKHKLGLAILGRPKRKILKELGIKTASIYGRKQSNRTWLEQKNTDIDYHDDKDEDDEYDDLFKWTGFIEIDSIIYPTMKGTLDIDQEGPLYILQGKLSVPDGIATFVDEFEFIDIMTMRNEFTITTPYDSFNLITSYYDLEIIPSKTYKFELNLDYQNKTRWIETGLLALYNINDGNDYEDYDLILQIRSPLDSFPRLDLNATYETKSNMHYTNLLAITNNSKISLNTNTKIDYGLIDTAIILEVKTPSFEIPPANITFLKNFTPNDSLIEAHINIPKHMKREVSFKLNWMLESLKNFYVFIWFDSPYIGMENTSLGAKVIITKQSAESFIIVDLHPLKIRSNSTLIGDIFQATSNINFNGKEFPITLTGNTIQSSINRKDFVGNLLLKDKEFSLKGYAFTIGNLPVDVQIKLSPKDGSDPLIFQYRLQNKDSGYLLDGSIRHAQKYATLQLNAISRYRNDWRIDLQVDTSHKVYNKFIFQANATVTNTGSSVAVEGWTPLYRIENPRLGASVVASGQQRYGRAYFEITDARGDIQIDWIWLYLENMMIKAIGNYQNRQYKSQSNINAFYMNPNQSFKFIETGGDINIDAFWSAGTNLTLNLPNYRNVSLEANLKLPRPIEDVHTIFGKLYYDSYRIIDYLCKYRTVNTKKNYGSWGNVLLADKTEFGGNVTIEWNNKRINNYLNLNRSENTYNFIYKLNAPKYINRNTFVTGISYTNVGEYHNITCEAFYPEQHSIGFAKVDFKEFANMNGTANVTIPFRNVNYTGVHFITKTDAHLYNRYLNVFWPNDNALLDCRCVTQTGVSLLESNTTGVLLIEVPLTTRHIANVDFSYQEQPRYSVGTTTVDYNGNKVLDGKYNCLSESRAGFDKDTIHVEVQNKLVPIGADYVHGYEYGASRDGTDAPTKDTKHLHLYHLKNSTKFNITGEMNVRTSSTGRQIALLAIHSNRTVRLWTDYDVLDQQFKQHSRLELSPSIWIEYDLNLLNNTMDETFNAQRVQINLAYPRRNFTAEGAYNISDSSMSTDISLVWDKDKKTVQAGLDWRRVNRHREEILFQLKHPSFQKDVSFLGEYEYDEHRIFDTQLTVDYSLNPQQTFKFGCKANDNTDSQFYNYSYNLWAVHDATNLNLNTRGGFYWNPYRYNIGHYTDYKRSYLPLQTVEAAANLDFILHEIEMKKRTGHDLSYLWAKYAGQFPIYTTNMSTSHEMNNASGEFYLNFVEKLIQLNLNMTTDGSQSLHMNGYIPDARSAIFDIWRDYEDIKVSDVAYYLRLNHSRLIVSSLLWRPDLIHDIQTGIRSILTQIYNDLLEGINNSKQYIRAETNAALHGIWDDAKPIVQDFLDDLRELRVIENDVEEFKLFLNKSYHANEFYIKDIVNMSMIMSDELALKAHLESLPAIVGEIWEVMGESGMKIKKSIIWAIEKIKEYYQNTADFIRGLLDGDPVDRLSDAFKSIIEKYDDFIKNLHVAFIQYMEQLWKQTYLLIVNNWHKTLAAIEPTFLKLIHYLETIVWNTGREFLDFLYIRKHELIESPYFVKFQNFTMDLDRFYRDITGNNTIVSITKYIKIAWNFLKEKYFSMVPFGKELQDVVSEILAELNELKNLPSIQFITEKLNEIYSNIKWFYDYFDIESRLHHFIMLLHKKLTDLSQNALEAENRYRAAKTKFIFEPNDGIMLLEQKLPMSWHAFNQTPKFQEIPEIKALYDIQNYFTESRASFWDFYYDYKAYTELSGWLPPFKAQALLVGSRYFVTFDGQHYEFQGTCSYLLATDYLDRNFSIIVSYNANNPNNYEFILLLNKTIIHVNIFDNSVRIGDKGVVLPVQIGDTYIYRELEILFIKSGSGYQLECNMKLNVCAFEVNGWYFGKTAGLWGTINNEPSDDFLTSQRTKAQLGELHQFTNSWALENCNKRNVQINNNRKKSVSPIIEELCDEFFISKLSQLTTCFPRVTKQPYLTMCLNSATEEEACSSAYAYISVCSFVNTPLRIPDVCVKCKTLNGTTLNEGQTIHLNENNLPQSADTVFIIEAKDCNKNLRSSKNFDSILELLNKELLELNLTNNRFSVVIFGGDGVYDEPRSLVIDGNVFMDFRSLITYIDSIPIGNGNIDIFEALIYASKLLFRPGVSKNFILMPCSECKEYNMKLDYASLHQLLLESDITLHILMNEEFSVQKLRENKIPFGIDRIKAYTKKDTRELVGDIALRKQVSLPKSTLGICTPLALETNGTIFSSKNFEVEKRTNIKKIATVFAKRVAATARPTNCVNCECTAFNTAVSYMECFPCTYPTRANIDYGFDEDMALSLLQPAEDIFGSFERR